MEQTITVTFSHSHGGFPGNSLGGNNCPASCRESHLAVEGAVYLLSKHEPGLKECWCSKSGPRAASPISSRPRLTRLMDGKVVSSQRAPCLTWELRPVIVVFLVKKLLNQPAPIVLHFLLFCVTDFEPRVHSAADWIASLRCLPSIILVCPAFTTMATPRGWGTG